MQHHSLLAKKRLITQFLLVFFAIFLINSGRKTLATLTDYESVFVEINEENDPASKDLIESFTEELNATYRTQLNMKITLSSFPYVIRFSITGITPSANRRK